MKNNSLAVLAIFVLSGVIVTGSTLAAIQPIFASSEQEATGEDEPQDQTEEGGTGSEGSDESETSETEEGNVEGGDNNQIDEISDEQQQQQGSEIDEVGGSGVASQQSGACPAVAIGGPTYEDENGCPVPCPKSGEVDSIPEGCPLPTDETAMSDVQDTIPTQTPSIPNPENTGVGQPRPPYKIDDPFTSFSSELPTTPDNVLQMVEYPLF